ncbi:Hypothetical predicted protein [Mytilus galloprovincialis]|uniref:Uncharacterized protein n=1 Tax=Mytilus galloprovincialis TaxID=29158 RepID=A0A8B6EBM2_MYTGA|nr:Hypothetical predicted protein [Mytilus galloprovincialis]
MEVSNGYTHKIVDGKEVGQTEQIPNFVLGNMCSREVKPGPIPTDVEPSKCRENKNSHFQTPAEMNTLFTNHESLTCDEVVNKLDEDKLEHKKKSYDIDGYDDGKEMGKTEHIPDFVSGLDALEVNITSNITANIGDTVELKCRFVLEGDEDITRINLQARISDDYENIAAFYPPSIIKDPSLNSAGQYLHNDVNLTNPTNLDNATSMLFYSIQCRDDKAYRCIVKYDSDDDHKTKESDSTMITVNSCCENNPCPTTEEMTTEVMTTEGMTTEVMTTEEMTTEGMTTEVMTTEGMTTEVMTTEVMTTEGMATEGNTTEEMTTQNYTTTENKSGINNVVCHVCLVLKRS